MEAVDECGSDTECMWMNVGVCLLIVGECLLDAVMNVWRTKDVP